MRLIVPGRSVSPYAPAKRLAALALVVGLIAAAAGSPIVDAQDSRLTVVASFSILADVAQNVAGDAADVVSLIPVGANPHAYSASAQDVVTLSQADLVLIVGANYEEGLLPVLAESAGENVVVASDCVPIQPVWTGDTSAAPQSVPPQEGDPVKRATCEAHHVTAADAFGLDAALLSEGTLGLLYQLDCGGDHAGEGDFHAEGGCDPHVWTDPVNAALWALMICDTLSARDPAHADVYAANTEAYLADLASIVDEMEAMISEVPQERRFIVTNHLAFNYFAARFGLALVGVIIPGGSTTSEPSVREVLDLIEVIQDYNVPAIFTENTVSEDLAQQIAGESGAAIVRLYTGSLSEPGGGADTYITYMRYNATAIADALR